LGVFQIKTTGTVIFRTTNMAHILLQRAYLGPAAAAIAVVARVGVERRVGEGGRKGKRKTWAYAGGFAEGRRRRQGQVVMRRGMPLRLLLL